ncbi:unnamed protein product [Rotaria sordida]|uniref:Condensin complex subunit 2 n=1 Tax=Rotaria sordida TaxID=392033 RepID=A0A815AKH7_9BILA|nr:unnamed protein product [Rotaria sordida]CAF1258016.1 unnamed protein product [Rotaria sordida]
MLSLSSSQSEPSALLSNARLTIATLIQRPSTITTSNAFDEFSILDHLIDVSNDVDRFEDGESRKFLNIAQLITASTCIYSRRVDALYKLINTFQSSSSDNKHDESISNENQQSESIIIHKQEENQTKKIIQEKKKKPKEENRRSFICNDLTKINLNSSKNFFLDRTSLFDLKLFQKNVPIGNKQFWINDNRPMIFDLLFHNQLIETNEIYLQQESEQLIDVVNKLSPVIHRSTLNDNDIPLPISIYDDQESSWNNENIIEHEKFIEKKKIIINKNRRKKLKQDIDLNIFRNGLTDEQQEHFRFHKMKPLTNKIKIEQTQFFIKKLNRNHFDKLIKDCPSSIVSIFIYPTITIHHLTVRERYSTKIDQSFSRTIRSPSIPITDVLNENVLISSLSPPTSPLFTHDFNEDIQEDVDIRLQTDMEHILDAATYHSNEEQENNKIFLELRSLIMSYMNEHDSVKTINLDDLLETLHDNYSLPLVFSQLLHLCATTQRYYLHSTSNDNLFIQKK